MQTYNVFYLVSGDDEENQNISDTATLSFNAEDLDALLKYYKKVKKMVSIQLELEQLQLRAILELSMF